MIGVADADPARADRLGLLHRDLVGLGPDDEAQAVVAIDGRRARRLANDLHHRPRIDPATVEHLEIGVQPGNAVRLDPTEVARRQHVGGQPRVGLKDADSRRRHAVENSWSRSMG